MATGDRNGDIAAYDAYCDTIHGEPAEDREPAEDLYYATLSNPSRDDEIERILAQAVKDEDFDLVDLCETALKQIVQPHLKRQALERIAERLNARGGK